MRRSFNEQVQGIIRVINRLLLAFAIGSTVLPALAADVRVPLPGGGALVLPAPSGWKQTMQPGPIPTTSLTAEGGAFQVLVSPLVRPDGSTAPADPESLRKLVSAGAQDALSQAVEKSLPLRALRGESVQGSYFSATDRAPKPGEFKYLTQGAMSVQGLPVSFTILSNGAPQLAVEPALRMLQSARREQ
jgi:hypothetical protein